MSQKKKEGSAAKGGSFGRKRGGHYRPSKRDLPSERGLLGEGGERRNKREVQESSYEE